MAKRTKEETAFTATDHAILDAYIATVDALSNYFGPAYEIVLHSLEDKSKSVIAIKNAHTGRTIGSPITDYALHILNEIESGREPKEYLTYFNIGEDGSPIKSITVPIRGDGGKVIGMICFNLYLNAPFIDMINTFCSSGVAATKEHYASNTDDLLYHILDDAKAAVEKGSERLPSQKNKTIIYTMAEKGAFNIKNSVQLTAEKLGISKNTVYLHLRHYQEEN